MNNKISILVSNQVPSFVRDEYPKFISFLEAYYEFLEQEYPELNIEQNDALAQTDVLRNISDVDKSLEKFEQHFYNSFLPYIPKNVATTKDIIIKNIMPLYLAKGSEKSFRLLFRMLFDENVAISYPRDNILRASDGRWVIDNILNVSDTFYSLYTSDGVKVEYILPEKYESTDFVVYVNNSVVTNYTYLYDYKTIIFNTAPAENATIKIEYLNFNPRLLQNRELIGQTSSARSVIEKVTESRLATTVFYEFFINNKNTVGTFLNNETIKSTIFDKEIIPVYFIPFSTISNIVITNAGAKYNVGDPVPIFGTATEDAIAVVDAVTTGVIESIIVDNGGIGFKVNNDVFAVGYSTNAFSGTVQTVDPSGITSSNTIIVNDDLISNYASIIIDQPYGFPANVIASNTAVIQNTISFRTISDLGPITSITVDVSTINSTLSPDIDVTPEPVANGTLTIKDLGIIGKININDAGLNYNVGEYLTFTNNGTFAGYGANAEVAAVAANGAITRIKINSGGLSYQQDHLPFVSVNSAYGSGANLTVFGIMGDEESLLPQVADGIAGAIQQIRLIYSGLNYEALPVIDLSQFGDGKATAEAVLRDSLVTLPGRWTTSDGKLSNRDINLQGKDYFIDFSYIITSQIEFKKYKEVLKNLLHPAGLINYSMYTSLVETDAQTTINIETTNNVIYFANAATITVDSTVVTVDMR